MLSQKVSWGYQLQICKSGEKIIISVVNAITKELAGFEVNWESHKVARHCQYLN